MVTVFLEFMVGRLYNRIGMRKGLFITVEGCDGCGKSSATQLVVQSLMDKGYDVIHTREPGGIDIAEQIRSVILDPKNTDMEKRCEALLYAASRRQHLVQKVLPALAEGKIVVCERFVDSSLVYQGYARGIGIDEVWNINQFAIENHMPDLTLFMDVDYQVGLERIANRSGKDRLDIESNEFHQKVYQGYQLVYKKFKDRMTLIDASKPLNQVVSDMVSVIEDKLNG